MKSAWATFIEEAAISTVLDVWYNQDYFSLEEIVPKETFLARKYKVIELLRFEPTVTLIELRILLDTPITINDWLWNSNGFQYRGWRPPKYYNLKESYSQHILFNAFDFDTKAYTPDEVRAKIRTWKQEGKLKYLTGLEKDVNWVHFDCRCTEHIDDDGLFIFGA